MERKIWIVIFAIVILILIFGGTLARFYTDWLWFGEVGYRTVFWTKIVSQLQIGLIAGLLFFAIVYSNLWLARRLSPPSTERYIRSEIRLRMGRLAKKGFSLLILLLTLGASILVGLEASTHWLEYQTFANATQFGHSDPIFGRDIGFYVFKFGFLKYLYGWLMFTLVVAAAATAAVHYIDRAIEVLAGTPSFAPHVKAHLSVLLAAALFVKAWGYRLNAFDLLFSPTGVVFGPGYADVHARLIAIKILMVVAVFAGVICLVNIFRRGIALPAAALVILVASSLILGAVYPELVQQFRVKPNEIARESKFIAYNIESTRRAFGLDLIREQDFPALNNLSAKALDDNRATINSIRLWDYRPLDKTYSQLQELGPYYQISNVDVDRYTINGEIRQVTLAARELSLESTTAVAGTWVNQHFQYTHGYGAVMSPVNRATEEGLPDFFVKGLPPSSNVGIDITRPQVYFGEITTGYVVVNSQEKEFDYPAEGQPVYTRYQGKGGIPIGKYLQRLAFAWRFSDVNLVLKNPITQNSRLMFRREIGERVSTIFPFLMYDPDPYLVISGGKLYWMWDAYSTSRAYPYSTPSASRTGPRINYMRNAAKVVIDAYDGTVDYYIADDTDPVVRAYARIFPGVFKPMTEMPEALRSHIRYPEALFLVQSEMLLTYHMRDPQVFYNKGDRWDIPREIVGDSEEQVPVEPYYVVMRLPGKSQEEFLLMRPFTPINKDNMIAWIAARCGPENYGEVILYQFPKEELIYGPAQIESRINQDAVISPQITLWSQSGSRVIRGNLLVIPIEDSIVYVEPLYLESQTSKIPELKRVIVSYGTRIAMEPTLDAALARVFHSSPRQEVSRPQAGAAPSAPSAEWQELVDRASEQLSRAQERQRQGDWSGYGEALRDLEQTLGRLRDIASGAGGE